MKSIKFFFAILFPALLIYSCEEVCPCVNLIPPTVDSSLIDTTYISTSSETPQTKMILIEDFTGVRCPNCPNAAKKIEDLQALYPGRILATAIHTKGIFGTPYPESKNDFRTDAGLSIYNMLPGAKGVFPIGDVSRTKHIDGNGNFSALQLYSTWPTYVDEELLKSTNANIYITGAFVDTSDIYKMKIKLHYTQTSTDTQALTIYLVEDNIIDLQKLPTNNIDTYYVHKHVLRAVLTNFNGDDLKSKEGFVLNRVFEKEYKIEIKPEWVKANCSIIAFVHKKGYNFDIIHVQQKALY